MNLTGWRWWRYWLWLLIRHPRARKTLVSMARYHWAHRDCDLEDFHHALGCAVTPERD